MTKAQMPGSSDSGRCEPVTGDTSQDEQQQQQQHQETRPAVPMQMMPLSASSSTLDNSHALPPSPPSTPSTSPRQGSWSERDERRSGDEIRLREVLSSMARQEKDGKVELPETPESTPLTMSPAEVMVRHQPNVSARDFVTLVLPRLCSIGQGGRRYLVEDAGMELVCSGWTGAVLIDTKPTSVAPTSLKSRSMASSFGSNRMSRGSSSTSCSYATGSDRRLASSPKRTLLTRIAADLMDTKDLRSNILDALDHATEKLQVDNVVFVLDRNGLDDEKFRAMVHGLCYVGASIVGHGTHGSGEHRSNSQGGGDEEEDVHAPRQVAPGLVLLSVDV